MNLPPDAEPLVVVFKQGNKIQTISAIDRCMWLKPLIIASLRQTAQELEDGVFVARVSEKHKPSEF